MLLFVGLSVQLFRAKHPCFRLYRLFFPSFGGFWTLGHIGHIVLLDGQSSS